MKRKGKSDAPALCMYCADQSFDPRDCVFYTHRDVFGVPPPLNPSSIDGRMYCTWFPEK